MQDCTLTECFSSSSYYINSLQHSRDTARTVTVNQTS